MAEVDTINVPDFGGVTREVATLSLALRTEDAAAESNPRGTPLISVRRDTLATNTVSADGDYIALSADSRGALHVAIAATALSPAKAEDAAHTTADVGMAILGVRRDAAASGADTDGDYATLNLDATGRLWVNIGAAASSIAKAEDAAHTTADVGVFMLGVRADTSATTATTDGDYAGITLDANGKLWARIGANDTLYTEDAAAASDPVGPVIMGVRRDTLSTSEVSADGDNVAIKADSRGALHVNVAPAATSIAKAEDAAHSTGEAGAFILGVRRDTSATTATTDGDYAGITLDANGKLWARIGANDTLYTEDAAAASDPVGQALILVRRDTLATNEVSADGDNVAAKATSKGELVVNDADAIAQQTLIAKRKAFIVDVAPTVTAGAYSAGDVFGTKMEITAAARASGAGGILRGISMFDEGANGAVNIIEVLIFGADPSGSTIADNDALAIVDADGPKLLGCVTLSNITDTGDGKLLYVHGLNIPYVCSGSDDLFAVAVQRGATFAPDATDGVTFRFHLERD